MSEARTEITEADRLLAEPVTIEHPVGRRVELAFTMRALVQVERVFGSLVAFETELNEVVQKKLEAPILTFVVRSLDALLHDDTPAIKANRADCLELNQLSSHVRAIRRAWVQAWPEAEEKGATAEGQDATGGEPPNPNGAQDAPFPGPVGTTSASSDSDLTPAASGA